MPTLSQVDCFFSREVVDLTKFALDPLGILKEGEIFYRSSRPQKDPRTEMLFHVLTGDVVVSFCHFYL